MKTLQFDGSAYAGYAVSLFVGWMFGKVMDKIIVPRLVWAAKVLYAFYILFRLAYLMKKYPNGFTSFQGAGIK